MKAAQRAAGLARRIDDYAALASDPAFTKPGSNKKNSPEGVLARNGRRMRAGMNGAKLPSYKRPGRR